MLIRMSTILFATAVALGVLFLTPAAGARPMKECSARYHAPAKVLQELNAEPTHRMCFPVDGRGEGSRLASGMW
jgi:hypothetical protein